MKDLSHRCFKQRKAHLDDQKCHDKSRNIFNSSVSKGVIRIGRLTCHLHADKADDGGGRIGQVVKCICHNRNAVYQKPDKKLGSKEKKIAEDSYDTR